jgi:hypothetical protein
VGWHGVLTAPATSNPPGRPTAAAPPSPADAERIEGQAQGRRKPSVKRGLTGHPKLLLQADRTRLESAWNNLARRGVLEVPDADNRVQSTPWGEPPARIGSMMDTSPTQAQFAPAVPGWRAQ